jgi:Meckel syndrome type 1 protein
MSSNQSSRQSTSEQNVNTRQDEATQRSKNYSNAYESNTAYYHGGAYYPPPPPPAYGGYYYNDDDDAAKVAAGVVVGAAVGAAAASSSSKKSTTQQTQQTQTQQVATLPCTPKVVNKNSVTYFVCGQTYYVQAYGSSGPMYMPVQPPS